MSTLLHLPHEILLWIYRSLNNMYDAVHLAQSCKLLSCIFDRPQNRLKIFLSVINNMPRTPSPDKAWLEDRFGAGSLWQPEESDIPSALTDSETRTFLTTVGFPAVKLRCAYFDSTHLTKDTGFLEPYDADELYGERYPDDDSPPTNLCFHFGSVGEWMMMVSGEDGDVSHYDPAGWDHADGYQGMIAGSLESFAVLLGMLAEVAERPYMVSDGLSEDEEREEARKAILDRLRERMVEYDSSVEKGSKFWDEVFEDLE
ncbi:SUKH-4 immunity protein-domain-containing protein [Aspergillus pseudocaelatus]|uniref:SUKH-4 immunity protein-domain-containing protein n=1 Tax=Aspergillus pseudocaelatus TaxID=1825620 RepID=A0ABQ6WZU0_9EURO|nr:SUKH-4 immunity protein-domain-containing protein [Aspergillus pseudocaelatus]